MDHKPAHPDLDELVSLFYDDPARLGEFQEVQAADLPAAERKLLAHDEHMTVTVESFHGSLVDVKVLATQTELPHYSRMIVLRRQSDGRVVLFGLVRLNLDLLDAAVREEILSQRTPLGRVLIEHDVLRAVELVSLWRITVGPDLARYLGVPEGTVAYGRTALIHCNADPAVELLEIVG